MARATAGAPQDCRPLINSIRGISKYSIRKMARTGGVKRIKHSVYEQTRAVIKSKLEELVPRAIMYCTANGRKTVTSLDVVYAIKDTPGMGPAMGGACWIHSFSSSFDVQPTLDFYPPAVDEVKAESASEKTSSTQSGREIIRVGSVDSADVMSTVELEHKPTTDTCLEAPPTLYNSTSEFPDDIDMFDLDFDDFEFDLGWDLDFVLDVGQTTYEEELAFYVQYQKAQNRVIQWLEDVEAAGSDTSAAVVNQAKQDHEMEDDSGMDIDTGFDASAETSIVDTDSCSSLIAQDNDNDAYNEEIDSSQPACRTITSFFRTGKAGFERTCTMTK